jgi:hypothetical protein
MKTNLSLRTVQLPALLALAVALASSVLAQAPRPTPNQLVITENSSTDLSATYNGSPLTVTFTPLPPPAEQWSVSPPEGVIFDIRTRSGISSYGFIEPDNPALFNWIFSAPDPTETKNEIVVASDLRISDFLGQPGFEGLQFVPDGTTVIGIGVDRNTSSPIVLTFHDNAGSTELVPDNSSTFSLLVAGLMALFCVRRRAAVLAS